MQLVLTSTAGLVVWLVLWSIGAKGIDAFMITTLIVLVGCLVQIGTKYLPSNGRQ
ncbi:hypothetical protein GKE82_00630 [Conexibacter sp. W3-3-2]|uniref:hypothetical protein n=1 Tax=Solirubrobacterales TaxID=588673 RepID=UPI0012B6BA5B|nr:MULTISPECIES: hypothetical protein [Solirubrobacterales]MTD42847.1 hypothetical protein [Conexibacter sp. W3-3-2]